MIITKSSSSVKRKQEEKDDRFTEIDADFKKLFFLANGRIRFGTGTDGENSENIAGQFQTFTSSGTPDAENTIAHTVGAIPIGIIILHQDLAGSLYQGPTTGTNWSTTQIFLKCDIASVTFSIFLVQ